MICYKVEKGEATNRLNISKPGKFTSVGISYKMVDREGTPVTSNEDFRLGKFLPHAWKKDTIVLRDDIIMDTIAINFLAKTRNLKIIKMYTAIKVFTNKFCIDENQVSIIGALDTDILSKDLPIMTIIAEDLGYKGVHPSMCVKERYVKIGFYLRHRKKRYLEKEVKDPRPSLYVSDTKMTEKKIIASEWYKDYIDGKEAQIGKFKSFRGINDVYISKYQKIVVSQEDEIDAALRRICNTENKERLMAEGKILIIPTPDQIQRYNLTDSAILFLTDKYPRKDLFPYLKREES